METTAQMRKRMAAESDARIAAKKKGNVSPEAKKAGALGAKALGAKKKLTNKSSPLTAPGSAAAQSPTVRSAKEALKNRQKTIDSASSF